MLLFFSLECGVVWFVSIVVMSMQVIRSCDPASLTAPSKPFTHVSVTTKQYDLVVACAGR